MFKGAGAISSTDKHHPIFLTKNLPSAAGDIQQYSEEVELEIENDIIDSFSVLPFSVFHLDQKTSINLISASPLASFLSIRPIYMSVCNFRI